jgi:hypothetical protein
VTALTSDSVSSPAYAAFNLPLRSLSGVDFTPLQESLSQQDFQTADRITVEKLCELAGEGAMERKWLYFTDVDNVAIADLQLVDALWQHYSNGQFGFSVQRDIWLSVGRNWEKLWSKIAWKTGNNWTRYPQEFIWDLTAPKGHLPLTNQLRGVRVMASLMNHPAWTTPPS